MKVNADAIYVKRINNCLTLIDQSEQVYHGHLSKFNCLADIELIVFFPGLVHQTAVARNDRIHN